MPDIEMHPIASSMMKAVGHAGKTLYITFKSGITYAYHRAAGHLLEGLLKAKSPGVYFSEHIRNNYRGVPV